MSLGPPLTGAERVLVRMPSWLGDFVMAEPALRALEPALAAGALTIAGLAPHLELLARRFPLARRVVLPARAADAPEQYTGHDVAVLFTGSFRSAWAAFRARVPRRVGAARDGRGWLLTDAFAPALERGEVPLGLGRAGRARRLLPRPLGRSLAELLGLLGVPLAHAEPRLDVEPAALVQARARRAACGLEPDAPFLLVHAGARPGSSKGVPAALWLAAARLLARQERLAFVLVAAPGEEAPLERLAREFGGPRVAVLHAPAALLPELVAHTAEARLVWSGDSGPRHLARALRRATLVVAGPTDPRHCALGERERLVRTEVPCGPCHRELCPLAGAEALQCYALRPEALVAASVELLRLPPVAFDA